MMATQQPLEQGEQEDPVYTALNRFFHSYFLERDPEKTLRLLSDQIYSIGTGEEEVATDKAAFRRLLYAELEALSNPIAYQVTHYHQKECTPGCWDCFCIMELHLTTPDGTQMLCRMRLTAALHREGDDYLIDVLHASEGSLHQDTGEFLPLKFVSAQQSGAQISHEPQQELLEIVGQMMPGGIVGSYDTDGFPVYVANERMLDMMGYNTYHEFFQDIQGLFINSVHPEDREFVDREVSRLLHNSTQYEIEYRMRRKDGSYFWVHDIGRRTVSRDGREAVICLLVDISRQVDLQNSLQNELSTDVLTGVYNRKGGYDRIAQDIQQCNNYLFFMLDLDNFKQVNDIYGHEQGDQALCYIAHRLLTSFRSTDTVFRLGGDEFAVFVPNCPLNRAIEEKLSSILADYGSMMQARWPDARSTLSIGGIYGRQLHSFTELYQLADEVLYQVKKGQKGTFKIRVLEE